MASAPKLALSLKLNNILFTTDFSPGSEAAIPFARAIAVRFGSTVHVLHVLPAEPHVAVPLDPATDLDPHRSEAAGAMARLLALRPLKDIVHDVRIERGPLWHVIAEVLREWDIDLIVAGTHGRRGLKRMVLGSAAEEIFRRAACPVLTIGPHTAHDGLAEGRLTSILYATDFSMGSLNALAYAIAFARENQARLTLLHVLPRALELTAAENEHMAESCRQQMLELLSPVVEQTCQAEAAARFGVPAEAILQVAAERGVNLIVMGARRKSPGTAVHLPWATAHRVVCEAQCPVLTVRS